MKYEKFGWVMRKGKRRKSWLERSFAHVIALAQQVVTGRKYYMYEWLFFYFFSACVAGIPY